MSRRARWFVVLPVLAVAGACRPSSGDPPEPETPYVTEVPEGPGAAVEILVDCSGSMASDWHGQRKASAADRALRDALAATAEFRRLHPGRPVKVGVISFSDVVREVRAVQDYDPDSFEGSMASLPPPEGRTAIGDALEAARTALYRSGVIRKYILVITDGANTAGRSPEKVARAIARRSRGAVSISVVAVDMDSRKFSFLRELGGDILQADDPASLHAAVQQIYEGKILAEAADAGAGTPAPEAGGEAAPQQAAPTPTSPSGSEK